MRTRTVLVKPSSHLISIPSTNARRPEAAKSKQGDPSMSPYLRYRRRSMVETEESMLGTMMDDTTTTTTTTSSTSLAHGKSHVYGWAAENATLTDDFSSDYEFTSMGSSSPLSSPSPAATTTSPSGRIRGETIMISTAIIIAMIVGFYVVCTCPLFRQLWEKLFCLDTDGEDEDEDAERNGAHDDATDAQESAAVLIHEGLTFHLTGRQRRAVLEAIFSETFKVRVVLCVVFVRV